MNKHDQDQNTQWVDFKDADGKPATMLLPAKGVDAWRYSKMQLGRMAQDDGAVLITGESGTGKELLARHLHSLSGRRDGPFVAVNCSGLSQQLMRSELFGHYKGAFTGADQDKYGAVTRADGGTLFLDEIADMDASVQHQLLRFLADRSIEPVGGESKKANVRIIAATNKKVGSGSNSDLISDLFARFRFKDVHLPALRDRHLDIFELLFSDSYLGKHSQYTHITIPTLVAVASNRWEGNLRELNNFCDSLSVEMDPLDRRHQTQGEIKEIPGTVIHSAAWLSKKNRLLDRIVECLWHIFKATTTKASWGDEPSNNTAWLLWSIFNHWHEERHVLNKDHIIPLDMLRSSLNTGGQFQCGRFSANDFADCLEAGAAVAEAQNNGSFGMLEAILNVTRHIRLPAEVVPLNEEKTHLKAGDHLTPAQKTYVILENNNRIVEMVNRRRLPPFPDPLMCDGLTQVLGEIAEREFPNRRTYDVTTIRRVLSLYAKGHQPAKIVTLMKNRLTHKQVRGIDRTHWQSEWDGLCKRKRRR